MQIPSELVYIRRVSAEIEDFLKSNNVDDSCMFDIRLCVEEAIKNAIIHGNNNRKTLPVFISYSLEGGKFIAEIEDQGNGFDPAGLPDPTRRENLFKTGGRGVFIIQKLMDEIKYKGRGNKIFMVKCIKKKKGGDNAN